MRINHAYSKLCPRGCAHKKTAQLLARAVIAKETLQNPVCLYYIREKKTLARLQQSCNPKKTVNL